MFLVQAKAGANFLDIFKIKCALTAHSWSDFTMAQVLIGCLLDCSFASTVTSGLHLVRDN